VPSCKAITNAGKPCRSRAMPSGYCGGHDPEAKRKITGRKPKPMPVPILDLVQRYESGESCSAQLSAAKTGEDARRLREIQVLIEEQEQEAALGDRVKPLGTRSLDASLTDNGSFALLDTLGAEDENFAELAA
jgi:hypothetical protein